MEKNRQTILRWFSKLKFRNRIRPAKVLQLNNRLRKDRNENRIYSTVHTGFVCLV
jgi:hypothetical protein